METLVLSIVGMACGGCANTVRQALLAVEGVIEAEVSHVEASATVRYEPSKAAPEQLRAAVVAAGYRAI